MRSFLSLIVLVFIFMSSMNSDLKVSSGAFESNGMIPSKYSCEGAEVSPPLTVAGVPAGAKSLAIIVHDPDAPAPGGFTHWVVWNVDVNGHIPENFTGARQGTNGSGKEGYKSMCPPSGTHHYHFMVFALDEKLDLDKKTGKAGLERAMNGHVLAKGELVGLYAKK